MQQDFNTLACVEPTEEEDCERARGSSVRHFVPWFEPVEVDAAGDYPELAGHVRFGGLTSAPGDGDATMYLRELLPEQRPEQARTGRVNLETRR